MWPKDRHHLILSKLAATERLSIEMLMEDLQVSRETVRRDILELEAAGKLRRVHGGVERVGLPAEPPFEERKVVNAAAKRRIALAAARLVQPGMLVAIDAGTTTVAFANAIANIPNVCVVSNSNDVVRAILAARPDADVILIGGRVVPQVPGTHGAFAISQLRRFAPDLGIFSPVAIHPERGATDYHLVEAEFARAIVEASKRVVALADNTKIGAVSRVEICDCRDIDILVTDRGVEADRLTSIRSAGLAEIIEE